MVKEKNEKETGERPRSVCFSPESTKHQRRKSSTKPGREFGEKRGKRDTGCGGGQVTVIGYGSALDFSKKSLVGVRRQTMGAFKGGRENSPGGRLMQKHCPGVPWRGTMKGTT